MEAILKTETAEISVTDLLKVYDARIKNLKELRGQYKMLHFKKDIAKIQDELNYMYNNNLGLCPHYRSPCHWRRAQKRYGGIIKVFAKNELIPVYWWASAWSYKDAQYAGNVNSYISIVKSMRNTPTETLILKGRELRNAVKGIFVVLAKKFVDLEKFMYMEQQKKAEELRKETHRKWLEKCTNYEDWVIREKELNLSHEKSVELKRHKKMLIDKVVVMDKRLARQSVENNTLVRLLLDEIKIHKRRVVDLQKELKVVKIELLACKPVKCPVCLEMIEGCPVIFRCTHCICAKCISTLMQLDDTPDRELKCPICRGKL